MKVVCFVVLCIASSSVWAAAVPDPAMQNAEAKSLLLAADKLVSQGRSNYNDAVAKYTQVLSLVADSPRALYSRAEVLHLLKRPDECLKDLEHLLRVAPTHLKALEMTVRLSSQQGDLLVAADTQHRVVEALVEKGDAKKIAAASDLEHQLRTLGGSWRGVERDIDRVTPILVDVRSKIASEGNPDNLKALRKQERDLLTMRTQRNEICVNVLAEVIHKYAKENLELRMRRVKCALVSKQNNVLQEELKAIIGRDKNNLRAAALNALSLRSLGSLDAAKREVKRCLALDPESSDCVALHKMFKREEKLQAAIEQAEQQKNWAAVIQNVDQWHEMDPDSSDSKPWRWLCTAYHGLNDHGNGLEVCETLLQMENGDTNPQSFDIYLLKADLYLKADDFAAAEVACNKAAEHQPNHEKVMQYKQKLERLKQAKDRKDYYKILGVPQSADAKKIRKAYRQLSKELHPDHFRSKDITQAERDVVDQQFRDINEAKEVLLDDERRARYDNGEDVTKPQQQQQQGGFNFGGGFPGGFHHGGFPGGGGGQFHFQFG